MKYECIDCGCKYTKRIKCFCGSKKELILLKDNQFICKTNNKNLILEVK